MRDRDDPLLRQLAAVERADRAPGKHPDAGVLLAPMSAGELGALKEAAARTLVDRPGAVPMRRTRSRWTWVATVGAPLAAAAAIAIYIGRDPPDSAFGLPPYDMAVEGSAGTSRGEAQVAPDTLVRRSPDGRLTLIVRPREPSKRKARASVWIDEVSSVRAWPVTVQASDEGSFRIVAEHDALASLPGAPVRVVVLVADASRAPIDETAALHAIRGDTHDLRVFTIRLEVAP